MLWSRSMRYAVALISVLCYIFSFPPFDASVLIFLFASPFLTWAYYCKSRSRILKLSLLTGVISWMAILIWLRHINPFIVILLGTTIGLFHGAWFYCASITLKRIIHFTFPKRLTGLLALAALWVALEWLRSWIFSGFPWLPLAASMWQKPGLLQILEYTGSSGVSFVIIFFNLALSSYFIKLMNRERALTREIYIAAIMLLGLISFYVTHFPKDENKSYMFKVGMIQPHVTSDLKWDINKINDNIRILNEETISLALQNPDIILWPETAVTSALNSDTYTQNWVEKLSKAITTPLLIGSIAEDQEKFYNAACYIHSETGLNPSFYAKQKRVPFGEYVPLRDFFPFLETFIPEEYDLSAGSNHHPLNLFINNKLWKAGVLICYEDIFPSLAQASVQAGADFLIVLTNSGWYGEEAMPEQHAAHSVLRAIEYRRPMIRCGNFGWSGWIDEYGIIQGNMNATGNVFYRGGAVFDIFKDNTMMNKQTFYAQYGNWFVYLCILFLIITFFFLRKK